MDVDVNTEDDAMDWLCECGHRYGDHHVIDEDCCIEDCKCDGFNRVILNDYPSNR